MSTGAAIGIDLGTTFSCVGGFRNGRVEAIANEAGNRIMPSCVAFTTTERLIGEGAKAQAVTNPTNTVFDVKRLIGRRFYDEEVKADMERWPFKVVNSNGKPMIEVEYRHKTKHFCAEQISSMVLSKMKATAEAYLDQKVTNAVIAVPAHFNVNQRQATIDAGKIAGLNVLRLITEPTAAAIAYGLDWGLDKQRNVLVFDWGGGTFDVSILSAGDGRFVVKAVSGDAHLGGEDINSRLVDHFVEVFKAKHRGKDLRSSKKAISRLRSECEKAKIQLSFAEDTNMEVVSLFDDIDLSENLTRSQLEHLCSDLFARTIDAVKAALRDAEMQSNDVHEIVLVGGSTRIPKVQQLLKEFFKGRELKKCVNPDEAVALGAASLAVNLSVRRPVTMQDLMLMEVTPLSLGLRKADGMMTTVIKRNTPIPVKAKCKRHTAWDNQRRVKFKIFEGERARASDNHFVSELELSDIKAAPRGEVKFDVTFEIDESGILHVSAVERPAGKQNSIVVNNYSGRLSEKEVEQMLKEAEQFREEDERERIRVAARNELMDYVYSVKRKLEREEVKQKTTNEYRNDVLAACEKLINWTKTQREATKEDYEQMLQQFKSACSLL